MNIRRPTASDTPAFRALRPSALLDKPGAFVASQEEMGQPIEYFEQRLIQRPGHAVSGVLSGDPLVGVARRSREAPLQLAHKCNPWGMHVAESARGRGMARVLLEAVLAHARATPGVAKVALSVDSANVTAIRLYESLGFAVFARQADTVRLHGKSRDELQMRLRFDREPRGASKKRD